MPKVNKPEVIYPSHVYAITPSGYLLMKKVAGSTKVLTTAMLKNASGKSKSMKVNAAISAVSEVLGDAPDELVYVGKETVCVGEIQKVITGFVLGLTKPNPVINCEWVPMHYLYMPDSPFKVTPTFRQTWSTFGPSVMELAQIIRLRSGTHILV